MKQNVGTAIKEAFEFLMVNFNDTSRMLVIIEEFMKKKGFVSETRAQSVWERSQAYYGSWGWMPHYLCRSYHFLNKEKDPKKRKLRVFFVVYFAPVKFDHPIFMFGAVHLDKDTNLARWAKALTVNEGPAFVDSDQVNGWLKAPEDNKRPLKMMFFKVKPLIEVNSQPVVIQICKDAVKNIFYEASFNLEVS